MSCDLQLVKQFGSTKSTWTVPCFKNPVLPVSMQTPWLHKLYFFIHLLCVKVNIPKKKKILFWLQNTISGSESFIRWLVRSLCRIMAYVQILRRIYRSCTIYTDPAPYIYMDLALYIHHWSHIYATGAIYTPFAPLVPWASLAPWGLRKLWEPSKAFGSLGASFRLRGLVPLGPPCSHPLSLPGPLGSPWGLRKPWTFQSIWQPWTSVRLGGLVPLAPSPYSSPEPPWPLGPQEAFQSLQQPWGLIQTQGPCSSCSPLPPHPTCPLSLSGASGSLPKPSAALGPQSDSGALLPLLPLSPEPPWGLRKPWEPSEAFGSLGTQTQEPCSPCPPHPLSLPCLLRPPLGLSKPWVHSEDFSSFGASIRAPGARGNKALESDRYQGWWRLQKAPEAQGGPRGPERLRG